MNPQELSQLNDEQLLQVAKQNKPSPIFDAFFIGLLIGIIIFGFVSGGWWWLCILPLFMIRQFLKKPKQYEALQQELEKRNLKVTEE